MSPQIRMATPNDLDACIAAETEAFPAAEAATRQQFAERLVVYPNHFWVLTDSSRVIALVNGPVSNSQNLTDDMYANAQLHNERGDWQFILDVVTIPDYRKRGVAGQLLSYVIEASRQQGRKGLVLTCKDHLVAYYAKFGFVDEGFQGSTHGGVYWHQMRLTFVAS